MPHAHRQARFAPIVGIAVILLLAGCTPETAVVTPTPTSTAVPTRAAAAQPGSRIPVTCAELFTPETVAPMVGATVTALRDERTAPVSFTDVAGAQLGTLGCDWAGGEPTEFGDLANLTIFVAPDSRAKFDANYTATIASKPDSADPPVGTTAGDQSGYWCEAGGLSEASPLCEAQMLVGNYWVTASIEAVAPVTETTTSANMKKVLARVAAALDKAGEPRTTAWKSPVASPPDFCTDAGSTAQVRSLFGSDDFTVSPASKRTVDASTVALGGRDVQCSWIDPTLGAADIELLAGGAWAFPTFVPAVAGDSVVRSYASVTVPGASSALLGTGEGEADAYLAVGTTAVRVSMPDLGAAGNITALSGLIAAIKAN